MANEIYRAYDFELESNRFPIAVALPLEQEAIVGSLVKLDGRASVDPEGKGLSFRWRFAQTPIGSQVERFGFTNLEEDASIVSFAPDVTGPYVAELVVSDGSLDSDPARANIDVRVILVPYHQGIVPDSSFIWNYLSDFWNRVDGKEKFEIFWSSAIQISAAENLKLLQYDYNKSIKDIQEVFQRRWLSYEPGLVLDRTKVSFVLSDDQAGSNASTFIFDPKAGTPNVEQPEYSNQIVVPLDEGQFSVTSFGASAYPGRLLSVGGRTYTLHRSGVFTLSVNNGDDGEVTVGSNQFIGSGFIQEMEGDILRILGSIDGVSKDWAISSVVSTTEVFLVETNFISAPSFAATISGLSYSVLPAKDTHSVFISDSINVPAGLQNQIWRFSAILISSEHDYEKEGVSSEDVIEVEVTRVDLGISSIFYAQVVSVDRNRLGFVMNLEDLKDGVAGAGLTQDIQVTLAADLQVDGIGVGQDGKLLYMNEAGIIQSTISSTKFKRAYYERPLTSFSDIDVGAFVIHVRPVQVIRNKKIPVDETVVSVPILQEYVRQPQVVQDNGALFLVTKGGKRPVSREPFIIAENLDYVIDDESSITGSCNLTSGTDEIEVPFGDLLDRSINEEDVLEITVGFTTQKFTIRRILSPNSIRVFPIPNDTATGAAFSITRRLKGKYIRFIKGRFKKKSPAPKRLWSEITYFDNNDAVEANFGVMVGLTRESLDKANADAPYKSAVAGLMYALSNGPTISNLKLASQILLGMPFTQAAGVIKEINPNYRLREDGSTRFGRILIEGRDRDNKPTGLTYIYLYPQGRQIFDPITERWISAVPAFSGIALNPETGKELAVGDSVAQFVPLSKGVEIQEYLLSGATDFLKQGNFTAFLRQYHAFSLVVNSDLVSASDIDLAAQFLKKARAHYVRLLSSLLKSVEDAVSIDDHLFFDRHMQLYELPGLGAPSALKFDENDEDASLAVLGGFFAKYLFGADLVTTSGSASVTSAGGGFISPRSDLSEAWDLPLVRTGDLFVIYGGINAGIFEVQSVASDTSLAIASPDGQMLQAEIQQEFKVFRPLKNPIWSGTVGVTNGSDSVSTPQGIGSSGASVGDILVFVGTSLNPTVSRRYVVTRVVLSALSPSVMVSPSIVEATGSYSGWLIRKDLLSAGLVSPPGASASHFWVNTSTLLSYFSFVDAGAHVNDWLNVALLSYGDTVILNSVSYMVLHLDIANRQVFVAPQALSNTTNTEVQIVLHPGAGSSPVSVDFLDRIPADYLELELQIALASSEKISTVNGSADVTSTASTNFATDLSVVPGDYLVVLEGTDSTRDAGFGPGVFMIRKVQTTTLSLLDSMTATGTFRYGIRRKIPNEG